MLPTTSTSGRGREVKTIGGKKLQRLLASRRISMKVSLIVLLTVVARVSVAKEAASSLESETRELQGHGQYYPAHQPTQYYPVYRTPYPTHKPPTPYPTGPKPTPNPTPYPTKNPTPQPTSYPTVYPTPHPVKYDPYPPKPYYPPPKTPRPTSYPTRNPTPQPTPYPTRHPTPEPSSEPSREPSREASEEPSENPTNSEEPSETPTSSEEPSENPTSSEEPSENPTSSEEPSESPTGSEEPSESPNASNDLPVDPTIYQIICDIQFNSILGLFCDLVQLNPDIAALLGAPLATISFFNPRTILNRVVETINIGGRKLQQEIVVDSGLVGSINERQKFFNLELPGISFQESINRGNANIASVNKLTVFAPTNYAFLTLPDGILAKLLAPNATLALANLLQLHIAERKIEFVDLKCDGVIDMMNDDQTTTSCRNDFKFQISAGNQMSRQPQIVIPNVDAINGIAHVVDEVILPQDVFAFLSSPTGSPTRSPTRSPTGNPTGNPTGSQKPTDS